MLSRKLRSSILVATLSGAAVIVVGALFTAPSCAAKRYFGALTERVVDPSKDFAAVGRLLFRSHARPGSLESFAKYASQPMKDRLLQATLRRFREAEDALEVSNLCVLARNELYAGIGMAEDLSEMLCLASAKITRGIRADTRGIEVRGSWRYCASEWLLFLCVYLEAMPPRVPEECLGTSGDLLFTLLVEDPDQWLSLAVDTLRAYREFAKRVDGVLVAEAVEKVRRLWDTAEYPCDRERAEELLRLVGTEVVAPDESIGKEHGKM